MNKRSDIHIFLVVLRRFLCEEKMDMVFRLEFCFFVLRQRKNKKQISLFLSKSQKSKYLIYARRNLQTC